VTPLEGRRPKLRTVLLALAAVVVAVTLFRVPLATVFTLGVLLICPLLMIGMHGGGHGAEHSTADDVREDPNDRAGDGGRRVRSAPASPALDLGPDRGANNNARSAVILSGLPQDECGTTSLSTLTYREASDLRSSL